jgi:hypothetical protein
MSATEILAELPKLNVEERTQILERLCELQEHDLLNGSDPTPEEREALDEALADFLRDRNTGTPWREVLARIRTSDRT